MSIKAMKIALEALTEINELSKGENAICLPGEIDGAMDSLRAAIEQTETRKRVKLTRNEAIEIVRLAGQDYSYFVDAIEAKLNEKNFSDLTQPQKRQWVSLPEMEVFDLADKYLYGGENYGISSFYKAIETRLKEKNA